MEIDDKKTAFSLIYEKEADLVFRYTMLRVANREEVIDIVQDTFAKFWQVFSEGADITHPRAFILTIARNKIIDWYRKKKPESLDSMAGEDDAPFEIRDDKMHEAIQLSAEAGVVLKAINKVSPQNREALHLRFVEDLSPSEIAEVLGVTANAASIRISRRLTEMRELLGIELE